MTDDTYEFPTPKNSPHCSEVTKVVSGDDLDATQRKRATKLRSLLMEAFTWEYTAEGADYWNDVYARLGRLSGKG